MSLKVRKKSSQQIWLNKDSAQTTSQVSQSDQHLVDRVQIVERPISQDELDDNFAYLEETKQPLDTNLTSVATLTTSPADRSYGLITRRADGDVRTRTLIGENNPLTGATRIVIDDGGGINQDPVIHIGSDIVTLNDSQTLTNKTIDAWYNNIIHVDADTLDGYHAADLLWMIPTFSITTTRYRTINGGGYGSGVDVGLSLQLLYKGNTWYIPSSSKACGCTCECQCTCVCNHSKCGKWW